MNSSAIIQANQNIPVAATTDDSQKRPANPFRKAAVKGTENDIPLCIFNIEIQVAIDTGLLYLWTKSSVLSS